MMLSSHSVGTFPKWIISSIRSWICWAPKAFSSQHKSFESHREITPTAISGPRFHAPLHIFPPPPGPAGGPSHTWRGRSLAAFNVTLLILVQKIPFNFYFDMQCAGNANTYVSFQVNAGFEQILFPWHNWARWKASRTIGSEWPD